MVFPYVAQQGENPKRYDQKEGLAAGTLFPGLHLPFFKATQARMQCSNTALCYLIFKQVNGKWQYVANTTENSCEVDDMHGTYDVRAANRYGSLSPAASL